jgi:hypothetical protein
MKKVLIGALALLGVAAVAPSPASAHVSVAVSLPGIGVFVGASFVPPPPPVVYAPGYYRPYPVYYAPARFGYFGPRGRGCHRGSWR